MSIKFCFKQKAAAVKRKEFCDAEVRRVFMLPAHNSNQLKVQRDAGDKRLETEVKHDFKVNQ